MKSRRWGNEDERLLFDIIGHPLTRDTWAADGLNNSDRAGCSQGGDLGKPSSEWEKGRPSGRR